MASPAIHPVRPSGAIDPRRPGEYPIVLGESLKGDVKSRDSLLGIRYNWQPKSGFEACKSHLTKLGDKYQLLVPDDDSDDGEYQYTGTLDSQQSGKSEDQSNSLALVFDKSKSAFVLETVSASLNMNLKSGPGQPPKVARELPQLPGTTRSATKSAHTDGHGSNPAAADDESADESNPYDFRHFLAEARENIEKSSQQSDNRTPIPGSRTPMSGVSTPVTGGSRFAPPTPQFKPAPATSKTAQPRKKKNDDSSRGPSRAPAGKPAAKRDVAKKTSNQPLSKARISDSDDDDGNETIDVSRTLSNPSTASGTSKPSQQIRKGHSRHISANIGSSPHIIINDDDGDLEIDMGSPPPEDGRARRGRVDPEMFRSHTGTPIGGLSSNIHSRTVSRPVDEARSRGRDRDRDADVTMKDIEAASSDEDDDVEEFELGSPREKRLSVPNSGEVSKRDDDEEDAGDRRRQQTEHAPTPPAPSHTYDDDDEDLLEAALEAALEEEDEDEGQPVGLGIGIVQDDESEVSEEE